MRYRAPRLLLAILVAVLVPLPAAAQKPMMMGPPRLVVMNLIFYGAGANSLDPGDPSMAGIAMSVLQSELHRYTQFRVVDSSLVADAVAAAESAGPPCNTVATIACAREIGRRLGATWVITGKLSKTSNLIWYLFGQLIEVSSGKLLTDQELELKGNIQDMAPRGARSLSRRLVQAAGFSPLDPAVAAATPAPAGALDAERVKAILAAANGETPPDLSGLDLSGFDLHGVDFRHANLMRTRLANANLAGAQLFSCDLTDAILSGADLTGATLDQTILRRVDFRRAKLNHASLYGTILESADLSEADLSDARIIGYLRSAKLVHAVLHSANIGVDPGNQSMGVMRSAFVGADLTGADFTGANLFKADFSYARLIGANLSGTDLSNSDLVQADLTDADLTGAKLGMADINGAIFKGAKGLSRAHGLNETRNRDKAIFDEHME